MKGQMKIKTLNVTGNYVSELDQDISYVDKTNPMGYFKMLINPIRNSEDEYEIRYMMVPGGYMVSGEAYIISGETEDDIDRKLKGYFEDYGTVIHTKVEDKNDLW